MDKVSGLVVVVPVYCDENVAVRKLLRRGESRLEPDRDALEVEFGGCAIFVVGGAE